MKKSVFVCRNIPERVVIGIYHEEGWRIDELTLEQAKVAAANLQACIDNLEYEAATQTSWNDFMRTLRHKPAHGQHTE
jgi:hypothetical protein